MRASDGERVGQFGAPIGHGLAGAGVDQVEREPVERAGGDRDGGFGLVGRVHPAKRLEFGITQRLYAERHAIDAARAVVGKSPRFDASRVGFERDFGVRGDCVMPCDFIQNASDGGWLHQRWRAAAKEDAGDLARAGKAGNVCDLCAVGREICDLVDAAEADVTVEVAVWAFGGAERPVDVNAETGIG